MKTTMDVSAQAARALRAMAHDMRVGAAGSQPGTGKLVYLDPHGQYHLCALGAAFWAKSGMALDQFAAAYEVEPPDSLTLWGLFDLTAAYDWPDFAVTTPIPFVLDQTRYTFWADQVRCRNSLNAMICALNDQCRWSRERIADWLDWLAEDVPSWIEGGIS